MMISRAQRVGAEGEATVAGYYQRKGYRVLDRNWRRREGEVDLIVARDNTVIFCEVKTRSGSGYGVGAEAVGPHKQRRLRVLASRWLQEARESGQIGGGVEVRFDVASLCVGPHGYRIDLIEDAF